MRYPAFFLLWTIFGATLSLSVASPLAAKDHFLTIGGGYDPNGNQASLESNVLMFQRLLAEQRPDHPPHDLFFSDGNDPLRDLKYIDVEKESRCSTAQRIMLEVFGRGASAGTCFRTHEVPDVIGPTERSALKRRFKALGRELKSGDRLIVYVTGHGGEAEEESSDDYDYEYDYDEKKWKAKATDGEQANTEDAQYNTLMYLWDSESVEAREFGRWLDQLDSEVTVVLVMVQCYSGGFSHVLFRRHDPELGLSSAPRCGFFSQLHDRAAAGCTADSNEADYQEYSTYFWAALGGKTRTGEPLERPDYNEDGQVSFAEAHAYAVIESDTIDIPLRTSESFLRHYSRLGRRGNAEESDEESGNPVSRLLSSFGGGSKAEATQGLASASGPLAELIAKVPQDQRAILELLPQKLGISKPVTVEAVRLKLRQAESDLAAARLKSHAASETRRKVKSDLREEIYAVWPEISKGYSPTLVELTNDRSDEFVETIEGLASYEAWVSASGRVDELAEGLRIAQRFEARCQRLLKTIETVVLAENLSTVAPTDIVERYRQLISLEEQSLAEPK